jgi:hypothetical protein
MCQSAPFGAAGTATFSGADFCTLYAATCSPPAAGYTDATMCQAGYATAGPQAHCRSYHLCNATASPAAAVIHCPHAVGIMLCGN